MATIKELDAYFAGSPSYDLYKKLYGSGSSNAGNINQLYNNQLAQSQQYYDAQVKKLEGQRAQQAQALAADNMRAGRNIMQQTVQGGLANSGVQAQARVLNNIAGQRVQSDLASRYATAIGDLELDRAQKAYGIENNRYAALLNDREDALNRQATYAGILSGYETRMANEEAAAAQAAAQRATLSADRLIATSADDLINYYAQLSDPNSQTAQSIINNYGADAYKTYLSDVGKRVSGVQTETFNAEVDALEALSDEQAARYYEQIAYDDTKKEELLNRIGKANYDKLVKNAYNRAKPQSRRETMAELTAAFRDVNNPMRYQILNYYNNNVATDSQSRYSEEELTNEVLEDIIRRTMRAEAYSAIKLFEFIDATDLKDIIADAERSYSSGNSYRASGTGLRSTLYDNDINGNF